MSLVPWVEVLSPVLSTLTPVPPLTGAVTLIIFPGDLSLSCWEDHLFLFLVEEVLLWIVE